MSVRGIGSLTEKEEVLAPFLLLPITIRLYVKASQKSEAMQLLWANVLERLFPLKE